MGISPALPTTIADGDSGHETAHVRMHGFLNGLFAISGSTPQPVGTTGSAGSTGNASDAGHQHAGVVLAGSGVIPQNPAKVPSAGSLGTASDAGHVHPSKLWLPADNGLLAATDDPGDINSQNTLGFGNLILMRLKADRGFTLTNIDYLINAVGTSLTTNQCFVGVYSVAGVRLGKSGDQAANFASSSSINGRAVAITPDASGSLVFNAGDEFFGAVLINGTGTQVSWPRVGTNNAAAAYKLSGGNLRWAQLAGPMTDMPASFTPSSLTSTTAYWLGCS